MIKQTLNKDAGRRFFWLTLTALVAYALSARIVPTAAHPAIAVLLLLASGVLCNRPSRTTAAPHDAN